MQPIYAGNQQTHSDLTARTYHVPIFGRYADCEPLEFRASCADVLDALEGQGTVEQG